MTTRSSADRKESPKARRQNFRYPCPTGQVLAGVTVNGEAVSVDEEGRFTVETRYLRVVETRGAALQFQDVSPDEWYFDAVNYVYARGLMTGYGSGELFGPVDSLARVHVALILYRLEGEPETTGESRFPDAAEEWYADAVAWGG